MNIAAGAIWKNVPTRTGVKTENVLLRKNIRIVMNVNPNVEKGLLSKIKPYGFTLFIKRYGEKELLDCLERNEKAGVVYHREGTHGDYDDFNEVEELIEFIKTGKK